MIDEDPSWFRIPALLRRGRTTLDTRDRAVPGQVRIVQLVFLIPQFSDAVQRVVLVVHGRHGTLQVIQRIRIVDRAVWVLKVATRRVTAVTKDRVVPGTDGVAFAARGTQQLLATVFREARFAIGELVRASRAGRIIIFSGIFVGICGWWKSRVANVHGMQRRVACQPKVITSDKVN